MKTQLMNKLTLSAFALCLALVGQKAFAMPIDLAHKDYIRITVPAESAETAKLVYGLNGEKVEAFPEDGDVVKLDAVQEVGNLLKLGHFSFLGSLDAGNPTLEILGTNPLGYEMRIRFSSTGESAYIDAQVPLVLEAEGATAEVVKAGNIENEIQIPSEPIFFTEEPQSFNMQGVLEIRFKVIQPEDEENDEDPAGDENEGLPEFGDSSGCAMTANTAGSAFHLLGLLPLAGLALARRRLKK